MCPALDPNAETDRLFAYHEATKHTVARVYGGSWSLDWDNQPDPFRRYEGAPRVALPQPGPEPMTATGEALAGLANPEGQDWPETRLAQLGSLLFHSMGISAVKRVPDSDVRYSLRVNPSSGNLHPTETWLAVQGADDLPDGIYHYDVAAHALERRRDGPAADALARLVGRPPGPGVLAVFTSIFWREAWKYRQRAYRYCLLDAGHAASSLALAARGLGYATEVLGHFPDRALCSLLDLDGTDEWPMLVLDLRPGGGALTAPPVASALSPVTLSPARGTPNRLSATEIPSPLIDGMHQSTLLEADPGPIGVLSSPPAPTRSETPPTRELAAACPAAEALCSVVRRRRSALDLRPDARASEPVLAGVLGDAARLPRTDFLRGRRLVDLYVFVHGVDGVEPGCWRHLPGRHALELVREGDVRSAAAGLSLGQEMAGHATAAFSMIADLGAAARLFGNRAYRYAHFEAGMLGHGIYLAATARGYDATGMGAFFDDDVHHWLGLEGRNRQVVYHHCFGQAVHDPRLEG